MSYHLRSSFLCRKLQKSLNNFLNVRSAYYICNRGGIIMGITNSTQKNLEENTNLSQELQGCQDETKTKSTSFKKRRARRKRQTSLPIHAKSAESLISRQSSLPTDVFVSDNIQLRKKPALVIEEMRLRNFKPAILRNGQSDDYAGVKKSSEVNVQLSTSSGVSSCCDNHSSCGSCCSTTDNDSSSSSCLSITSSTCSYCKAGSSERDFRDKDEIQIKFSPVQKE